MEAGVVTSVVRYEPASSFASYEHQESKEIFVIDGVFSDEAGIIRQAVLFSIRVGFFMRHHRA